MARRPGAFAPLTERQTEVATVVAQGLTNDQIAEKLTFDGRHDGNHVRAPLQRLGLRNRVELAVWTVRQEQQSEG